MLHALHVPDHTLGLETIVPATLAVVVLGAVAVGRGWTMRNAGSFARQAWLFLATSVFLFAVQAANFPLLDGRTSGHVLGGAAAAAVLGPWLGGAAVGIVVALQALFLNDGGITAVGANVFNMAVVGVAAGWLTFVAGRRVRSDVAGTLVAAVAAGWVSSIAAASVCAAELVAAGVAPGATVFAELVGQHALIGLVEGLVTALVVVPSLVPNLGGSRVRWVPLAAAAAIALALTAVSSPLPDALESLLENHAAAASR
jgi:cobalt/nickel transport system permease protein